jgi:hypothetical protein
MDKEIIMNTYKKMKDAFDKYNPTTDMLNVVYGLDSTEKYVHYSRTLLDTK